MLYDFLCFNFLEKLFCRIIFWQHKLLLMLFRWRIYFELCMRNKAIKVLQRVSFFSRIEHVVVVVVVQWALNLTNYWSIGHINLFIVKGLFTLPIEQSNFHRWMRFLNRPLFQWKISLPWQVYRIDGQSGCQLLLLLML